MAKNSSSHTKEDEKRANDPIRRGLLAFFGYFKGSWQELKLVRWPNRRATWGMTLAVLIFTGLFLLLIVSLDAIFSQLFNLIIK